MKLFFRLIYVTEDNDDFSFRTEIREEVTLRTQAERIRDTIKNSLL